MDWSFQLYSARDFQPWERVLETIAALGYRQVEGFGGVYSDPAGFKRQMQAHGLAMPTAHFPLEMLERDFDEAMRIAEALEIGTIIAPYLDTSERPADTEGWKAFADRLSEVHEKCAGEGRAFAWHNHDFEFALLPDGTMPMRLLLEAAPDIAWEIDVAWVVRGGADPLAWISEYGGRISAAHVKDIAPQGEAADEDGWADVGHGTLDWPEIMKALRDRTSARVFVMEHDKPNDLERFARRSIETAKGL